jgi:hypothetical protein
MKKLILFVLTISPIFVSCSRTNNDNFDLSNLKVPVRTKNKISSKKISSKISNKKEIVNSKLASYPDISQIIDSVKFGKADPFSKGETSLNVLNSDLKLTGFLDTDFKNYAFVNYLDNKGTLDEDSIGGVNTNLLPYGAKVLNIDPKNMKLIIEFNNENFIFEL